jgi:hypothetical protein
MFNPIFPRRNTDTLESKQRMNCKVGSGNNGMDVALERVRLSYEGMLEGRGGKECWGWGLHVGSMFVGGCDLEPPALEASSSACSRLRSF